MNRGMTHYVRNGIVGEAMGLEESTDVVIILAGVVVAHSFTLTRE